MEIIASKIISEHKRLLNYPIIELFIYTTFHALKYTRYTVSSMPHVIIIQCDLKIKVKLTYMYVVSCLNVNSF